MTEPVSAKVPRVLVLVCDSFGVGDAPDAEAYGDAGSDTLGNTATAVGGIQRIRLKEKVSENAFVDLDAAYVARDGGGPAWVVDDTDGPVVTARGIATGENYLRILDADDLSLMDLKRFRAAELATISVVSTRTERSKLPVAFLPGTVRFGIGLRNEAGSRLIDEGMTVELTGGSQLAWDTFELPEAAAGTNSTPR